MIMDTPSLNCIQFFCLISMIRRGFLPGALCRSPNTISGVCSKKPISFFQLIPHLQCCRPMNCCFIFLLQFGQTLLFFPIVQYPDCFRPAGSHRRSSSDPHFHCSMENRSSIMRSFTPSTAACFCTSLVYVSLFFFSLVNYLIGLIFIISAHGNDGSGSGHLAQILLAG